MENDANFIEAAEQGTPVNDLPFAERDSTTELGDAVSTLGITGINEDGDDDEETSVSSSSLAAVSPSNVMYTLSQHKRPLRHRFHSQRRLV